MGRRNPGLCSCILLPLLTSGERGISRRNGAYPGHLYTLVILRCQNSPLGLEAVETNLVYSKAALNYTGGQTGPWPITGLWESKNGIKPPSALLLVCPVPSTVQMNWRIQPLGFQNSKEKIGSPVREHKYFW